MLVGMLLVFEVHLAAARKSDAIFSEELLNETQAQVMTPAEARALGFQGVPDNDNLRLVAVTPRDRNWIASALERSPDVTGFQVHEVDM